MDIDKSFAQESFWKIMKEQYLELTPREKKKFLKKMFPSLKRKK